MAPVVVAPDFLGSRSTISFSNPKVDTFGRGWVDMVDLVDGHEKESLKKQKNIATNFLWPAFQFE